MRPSLKLVFMGVCGSGKTTLAGRIAEYLGCAPVLEADAYHSLEMKEKMRAGIALTDEDRWPWLDRIHQALALSGDRTVVATCSALRRVYRERLSQGELSGRVHFIFLDAPQEVIDARLKQRQHEYMPPSLLSSQFETLEPPHSTEPVSKVSVLGSEDEAVERIKNLLESL